VSDAGLFLSVVVPLEDDADVLDAFVAELVAVLQAGWQNWEIVLVDDASRDGTAAAAARLCQRHECLRYLRLSRRAGPEIAILAGLDGVLGDVIVVLQAESDPPALLPRFVERARASGGIVCGAHPRGSAGAGQGFVYRSGQRLFARAASRLLGARLPAEATLFMALTRPALNAASQIKDEARALRILGALTGWPREFLEYAPVPRRSPLRRKSVAEGCERALSLIVTNSTKPLRIVSLLGLAGSALNLLYIAYVMAIALFKPHVAEGWITLSLSISSMFFLLFLIVAVLCEYVGRLLAEARQRPAYFVAEERTSSVLIADATRRNVVHESA
jgi:polyisoprenyl-phosphate glycosyltransferase